MPIGISVRILGTFSSTIRAAGLLAQSMLSGQSRSWGVAVAQDSRIRGFGRPSLAFVAAPLNAREQRQLAPQ